MNILCLYELNITDLVLSIISSALSILIVAGGAVVYRKYILEHINLRRIDAYYGFYNILKRQLTWLKGSLSINGNYAFGCFLQQENPSHSSERLSNQYEASREKVVNLITTMENQYPLGKKNEEFQKNLDELITDYLLIYYKNAPNPRLINDVSALVDISSKLDSLIGNIIDIINENKP